MAAEEEEEAGAAGSRGGCPWFNVPGQKKCALINPTDTQKQIYCDPCCPAGKDMSSSGSASKGKIKLPLQLASLIHGEAEKLFVDGDADATMDAVDDVEAAAAAAAEGMMLVDDDPAAAAEAAAVVEAEEKPKQQRRSLNAIVGAAQARHVKELGSYVRAVCMRMGFGGCS